MRESFLLGRRLFSQEIGRLLPPGRQWVKISQLGVHIKKDKHRREAMCEDTSL